MLGKNHSLLFERPLELLGDRIVYETPDVSERRVIPSDSEKRVTPENLENIIRVKRISYPKIDDILQLKRDATFSLFVPEHRRIACRMIDIFMSMPTIEDFFSMAVYARDQINPYLFHYTYAVALLHRSDTQNRELPALIQSFPDKFTDPFTFTEARKAISMGAKDPIVIRKDYTASEFEEEQRLTYFREDIGVNLHHWHWHLVYPSASDNRKMVDKDRRGELFYYMHQQIIARYNFERLCNKLKRVEKFSDWKEPIKEAYFPKLNNKVASRSYGARVANQKVSNVNRVHEKFKVDLAQMEMWRNRIFDAIHKGSAVNEKGETIRLTEFGGIDILGNMIEASILSPNRTYYGDLHNMGHNMLACIHDPDYRYLEEPGVMSDVATAMRDPIFYRWHAFIDEFFQEFKATLSPYEESQLNYPGITITKISIQTEKALPNVVTTYWQQSDIDLSSGIDFQKSGPIPVRFTHLQHSSFAYTISVKNDTNSTKIGTCRIFLAPKFDESGNLWLFREQKNMFIELDKFTVSLKKGITKLTRASTRSSVSIPFVRTFRNLYMNRPAAAADEKTGGFRSCGCGWPHHLLIPKGTSSGMPCQLFVMISNYDDDKVAENQEGIWNEAGTYCGIKDKLYPDRRAMGYPFDRMPRNGVTNIKEFLTGNMMIQDVTITFHDKVVKPDEKM